MNQHGEFNSLLKWETLMKRLKFATNVAGIVGRIFTAFGEGGISDSIAQNLWGMIPLKLNLSKMNLGHITGQY